MLMFVGSSTSPSNSNEHVSAPSVPGRPPVAPSFNESKMGIMF
jgi:hypothetical protein